MQSFLDYVLLIAPGTVLFVAVFALVPARLVGVRAMVAIVAFVFVRDAMTVTGLWRFDATDAGVPWLRFEAEPAAYWLMAATSLALVGALVWGFGAPGRARIVWLGRRAWESPAWGLAGAAVVVAPFVALYAGVPIAERGGAVAVATLPAILAMAVAGNALEEVLFRGALQSALLGALLGALLRAPVDARGGDRSHAAAAGASGFTWPHVRAALATGVLFAACHLPLALLLTDVGWPLVAFVLLEGLVCGFARIRGGVVGAAITHGLAIFALASGLI